MNERIPDMEHHDLRGRVVSLEHGSAHKETRLTALEKWRSQRDIADAVRDEQMKGIRGDLTTIKSTLSRLVWLMVTGLAGAFMAFIINGGLKVP